MVTLPRLYLAARFLLLCFAALLVPGVAHAQQVLSVTPNPSTPISVQATFGTNAASQTVQVSNSGRGALKWTVVQPAAAWLRVSPTSGVNNGTLTLIFTTSGLAVSSTPYQTTFSINSNGGSATYTVRVTIVAATVPTLTANCPANQTVASPAGNPVVVTYTIPTPSGGTPPYTTSGSPASGSLFPVGTTTVQVTATSGDGQTATCSFAVTVTTTVATLYVTCPSNKTVQSSNGSAVAVTYSATTEGGVAPITVSGTPASGSLFPVGATTVNVNATSSDGQSSWCSFTVTVTYTPSPSTLIANCPANITVASPDGNPVVVTYTIPAPSGGTSPYTTSGSPSSGTSFAVTSTPVQVTAQDSAQPPQTATCSFTVTVTSTPPPSTGVGPQPTIQCPAIRIDFLPSDTVDYMQSVINANPGATTYCFHAGTYQINRSITPKTGNTFVGEYGAILDGTGWTSFDDSHAPFRVYDDPNDPNDPITPIDNVTIKNLVIRDMPHYGIHGSHTRSAANWIVEFNEIAFNKFGVMFTRNARVRNNYIHHNVGNPSSPNPGDRGGGYVGQYADDTILNNNELAFNGPEQKVGLSVNVTFRDNFVHHNLGDGIWFDLNNNANAAPRAALIEGNRIEDNRNGIVIEISIGVTIQNNTLRRNREDGVLISVSQNVETHHNVLEANYGGIEYFLNCGSFSEGFDLKNNSTHDNTVTITTEVSQNFGYANGFSHLSQCTAAQLAPYLNGDKNLTFSSNTYYVPSLSYTRYFLWSGWKVWDQWQALGSTMSPPKSLQDVGGSIFQSP